MSCRRDCEMPASSRRRLFDRSDQINQNSRGILVPPRGAGQTEQKAISLQCRKIRQPTLRRVDQQTLSLCFPHAMYLGISKSSGACPALPWQRQQENPEGFSISKKWWSLTGSNRRHPACKAGALPAELRPHSLTEPMFWLARADSNCRPHAYQACALTN